MTLYPILLNLKDRRVVIVGGGEVALRKLKDLLDAGARIALVAPEIHEEIQKLAEANKQSISLLKREYRRGDLDGAALAFGATNSTGVNAAVFAEARERGVFINAADDPPNCSFYLPSWSRRGDFILAVSTSGASPALAAQLRRELERHVPADIADMLDALRESRRLLQEDDSFRDLDSSARGEIIKKIANDERLLGDCARAFREGRLVEFLKGMK